jgi:hypothetical protein
MLSQTLVGDGKAVGEEDIVVKSDSPVSSSSGWLQETFLLNLASSSQS